MRQLKITGSITMRESQSLEIYLQEIGKIGVLTPEEEIGLAQRIKQGDQAALEKLIKANLRFVISVAKKYQYQGLELSDLINEGNLGLMEAAKRFDETKGFRFISYAVRMIRRSILYAISNHGNLVKRPKVQHREIINNQYMIFLQEKGYSPSKNDFFMFLNAKFPEVKSTDVQRYFIGHDVSLNVPLGEDGDEKIDMLSSGDPRENHPLESITKETLEQIVNLLFPNVHIMQPGSNGTPVINKKATDKKMETQSMLKDILARSRGISPYESQQHIEDIAIEYKKSPQTIQNTLDKIATMIRFSGKKGVYRNDALYALLKEHFFLK